MRMNKVFPSAKLGKRTKITAILVVAVIVVMLGAWAMSRGSVTVLTAVVQRGEFADALPFRGEVHAL
jgi:hypothetical protein